MLRTGRILGSVFLIAGTLFAWGCASSDEPGEEAASGQDHANHEATEPAGEAHDLSDASHGGPAAVWQEIEAKNDELKRVIDAGQLAGVHEIAFEIRDLVANLDEELEELEAGDRAVMRSQVSVVSDLAKELDRYGDAGNLGATQTKYEELQKALATISDQVPRS